MGLLLRRSRSKGKHYNVLFFSTSNSKSPFNSFFRENLKESAPSSSNPKTTDGILKNLYEFRARTTAPPPQPTISFHDLYRKRTQTPPESGAGAHSINISSIRKSLQNIKAAGTPTSPLPRPPPSDTLLKDIKVQGSVPPSTTAFLKPYAVEELGKKLRMLRPEGRGQAWFSVSELCERLARLRKMDEEQARSNTRDSDPKALLHDVKETLFQMEQDEIYKADRASRQGLSILGYFSGTPTSLDPPNLHLVEKYFHPDNMSSAEKLKIELANVRDEFKMSESDCGSARVQIAQLTTKIKHLSGVLHKKDVHSRKGLLAMVQRRKRLLKYLRRTDWDSYCFVISKLGLRDNPDHSYKTAS
ncbi:hypothetical protein VNO78_24597 [Psophocarpus tetragonolobus]|uniref:Small ribosomal subunit protein uS15c n=1 Tax=Psophocarpus tetragonolobus TaxID=3891 RepID=A0AAN9S5W7_PSOTE